jgi:hypothetical protein
MPAGTYALFYTGRTGELDAAFAACADGDDDALAAVRRWNAETAACVSEGFCPSCDGPLTEGRVCHGHGLGGGQGHGPVQWELDGYASEMETARPERMREIRWSSRSTPTA